MVLTSAQKDMSIQRKKWTVAEKLQISTQQKPAEEALPRNFSVIIARTHKTPGSFQRTSIKNIKAGTY